MRRNAIVRLRSGVRRWLYYPRVQELESRLPPGDMIGQSGSALWGLGLFGSAEPRAAVPVALVANSPAIGGLGQAPEVGAHRAAGAAVGTPATLASAATLISPMSPHRIGAAAGDFPVVEQDLFDLLGGVDLAGWQRPQSPPHGLWGSGGADRSGAERGGDGGSDRTAPGSGVAAAAGTPVTTRTVATDGNLDLVVSMLSVKARPARVASAPVAVSASGSQAAPQTADLAPAAVVVPQGVQPPGPDGSGSDGGRTGPGDDPPPPGYLTNVPPNATPDPPWCPKTAPPVQTASPVQNGDGVGGNNNPSKYSDASVRYFDGVVRLAWTDLRSDGFGAGCDQTRDWSNGPYNALEGNLRPRSDNGRGMVAEQLPYLTGHAAHVGDLYVITSSTSALIYDWVDSNLVPRFYTKDQLTFTNGEFILTDTAGNQIHFYDTAISGFDARWGKFKSLTDPYGNVTTVTSWTADGRQAEVQRRTPAGLSPQVVESWVYSYVASDANQGLIQNVTLRRRVEGGDWNVVRQVAYTYYDTGEANGNPNDLKTAIVEDAAGHALDTSYYRYYPRVGSGIGAFDGLKYAFNPQSYARLAAFVGNPLTATDAKVQPYADNYLEYDAQQRVSKEVVQGAGCSCAADGGQGAYTYSYSASPFGSDYNVWKIKTIETLPDNNANFVSRNIVYTNVYGEVILKVYESGAPSHTQQWDTFYKYDNAGRVILQANPSAVTGYDETKPDLLNADANGHYQYLRDNQGEILLTDYYPDHPVPAATETTPGGVAGYIADTKLQQGQRGTPILQSSQQYFARTGTAFDVTVTTPAGNSAISPADRFTYVVPPVPAVTALGITTGSALGGEAVPIQGSGFTGPSAVYFGTPSPATRAIDVVVNSDTSITARAPSHAAGMVDVTVVTPGGTSAVSAADHFMYVAPPAPAVSGLGQTSGARFGGSILAISGSALSAASRVTFGTTPAIFTVLSDNAIRVQVPAHAPGTVDVRVTTPGGTSPLTPVDQFTYVNPALPVVTGLSQTSGTTVGGATVTILGTGLTGVTAVSFDGVRTSVRVNSDTSVTVRAPAHSAGTVHVTVTTPGGTSTATAADQFTYIVPPAPVLTGLAPANGLGAGGTSVTIIGTNFSGATAVSFDGTPAASFTVNSPTQITARAPAHDLGTVDVQVTTPGGTSAGAAGDQFTYVSEVPNDPPVPAVVGLSPASGSTGGGLVTILGTGFSAVTAVTFGSTRALAFTVVSHNLITARAPVKSAGVVDVRVTTTGGTSSTNPADRFTYVAPPMPVVTGLSQTSGAIFGGIFVTVVGTGFTGATRVAVGGTPATDVTVHSDTAVSFRIPAAAAGRADVRMTTPGGTSAVTAADQYTYVLPPAPAVTGLSLTTGTTVGGVTVAIVGTGFTGATQVAFGGTPASQVVVLSDTAVSARIPAQAAGLVDVTVTTPGGTSAVVGADQFSYVTPPVPVVAALGPASGSGAGGTEVLILGTGLSGATAVDFGGTPSLAVTIHSDGEIVARAPLRAAGVVDVTVTTPGGTSAVSTGDRFTYLDAVPVVRAISPATGTIQGGDTITLVGSHFTGTTAVFFGGIPATGVIVLSDEAVSAHVPAQAAGVVDVTVTTPSGTSLATAADRYTYVAPAAPTVAGLGPNQGTTAGRDLVTVIGAGFSGATAVSFGTVAATSFTVLSESALIVRAPAQDLGMVDVTVTTPGGTSAASAADEFTYVSTIGTGGSMPVVAGVSAASGSTLGGDTVTIIGTGFLGATAVTFGTTRTTSFTRLSAYALLVQAPAHAMGTVDVTVTTPQGTSAITPADQFRYVAPPIPTVVALSVTSGPVGGSSSVLAIGTGLSTATAVSVGSTPVSSFTVLSDSALLVRIPAHPLVNTYFPIASTTVYRNPDGTGAETTHYDYTWYPGTPRMQSMTVTKPTIVAAQNGPDTPDVMTTVYDVYGRPIWTRDGDGFLNYTDYDQGTGAATKTITDVDTTRTTDFQNLPAGWVTPPGGGLYLETQMGVDSLGREIQRTDPNGNITYTVYDDPNHEMRVYPGWNPDTNMPTGPTQVTREDRSHTPSYVEKLTMSAPPHVDANGQPDGSEPIRGIQSLTRTFSSQAGQVVERDAYVSLDGTAYATDPYLGRAGTNYYVTTYDYDDHGRLNRVGLPTGTINRTVYDGLGRVISTWVGTSDMTHDGKEWSPDDNGSPSNMVQLTADVYDNGGVGDGNLTQMTQFPGGGAAARVTQNYYDWRDRLVASKQGVQASENDGTHRPIFYTQYDNLDEVVSSERYDGDGITITATNGVPDRPAANRLRAKTTTAYDDQGRVYQTNTFSVDQNNGTVSTNSLTTGTWYDHRGEVIKTAVPGGFVTKNQYDGAGRLVTMYQTDGLGDRTWADAGSVANNDILSQTDTQYDADDNPILVIQRERFHDETQHGALGDANSDQAKARASYVANYYDAANRQTDQVNVGTNGGTVYVRPDSVPTGSDTVLVTHTDYDAAGRVLDTVDPRGIVTLNQYDLLGRITESIEDYTDGTPTDSSNRITNYTYDGDNHILTLTATLADGSTQTTQYVYGVTGIIHSNDLLAATIYPDNGQPHREGYTYDALGELVTLTDRNGNTHSYSYDVLGRLTADAVTTLGQGVAGSVRRLEVAYDTGGRPYLYTEYDAASGGHVVNQVERIYNGLSQLITEYQAHAGAVNPATTPKVQYGYSEMANGVNHSRLTSMTYPDGRVIRYNYAAGVDDAISRLTSLSDSSGVLESYLYLGLGTVVERAHPEPGVNLTYISPTGTTGDAGDQYTGLDRFGRVVDQLWLNTTTGQATDEFTYGYDRDGNPLYRDNLVNSAFGELYQANGAGYDGLNRLTDFARGTLNATHDGLIGPASRSQDWSLDVLGNWQSVTSDGTPQSRDHNAQNEITDINGSPLTYDNNGNTTTDDNGNSLVYDAWNRLVQITASASGDLVTYRYDALGRRITTGTNGGMPADLCYSAAWQVVEEQVGGMTQAQYVWSPVYVDALVERDTSDGTRLYVQQNANWNVTAIVDSKGTVQERYIYDPYGQATVLAPDWTTRGNSSFGWVYLHQGGRYDSTSGLYDFRNREASPTLGRWMQEDPIGFEGGQIDLYAYERDQPVQSLDPSGLKNAWDSLGDFFKGILDMNPKSNVGPDGRPNPPQPNGQQPVPGTGQGNPMLPPVNTTPRGFPSGQNTRKFPPGTKPQDTPDCHWEFRGWGGWHWQSGTLVPTYGLWESVCPRDRCKKGRGGSR